MVVVYCGTPDVRLLANSGSMADVAGDRPRPIAGVRVPRDTLSALNASRYFPATNNRRWKPFWKLKSLERCGNSGAQGASPPPGSPPIRNASHIFSRYDGAKHHIL